MVEIKKAEVKVTTKYHVTGELTSYYSGPNLIHDSVDKTFTDKAKADAYCAKQSWLKPKQKHIHEVVETKIIKYL